MGRRHGCPGRPQHQQGRRRLHIRIGMGSIPDEEAPSRSKQPSLTTLLLWKYRTMRQHASRCLFGHLLPANSLTYLKALEATNNCRIQKRG
jgi:hypothetical protein